jgi:hypothetical protein
MFEDRQMSLREHEEIGRLEAETKRNAEESLQKLKESGAVEFINSIAKCFQNVKGHLQSNYEQSKGGPAIILSGSIEKDGDGRREHRVELHIAAHRWSGSWDLYVSCWNATANEFTDKPDAQKNSSWKPVWANVVPLGDKMEIKQTILSGTRAAGFISLEKTKEILSAGIKA